MEQGQQDSILPSDSETVVFSKNLPCCVCLAKCYEANVLVRR